MGCSKGVVDVVIEQWCKFSDKVCLDYFLYLVVNVFFGAKSEIV